MGLAASQQPLSITAGVYQEVRVPDGCVPYSSHTVLGARGLRVQRGSGVWGAVACRIISNPGSDIQIGLATGDVSPTRYLGDPDGPGQACGWWGRGHLCSSLPGLPREFGTFPKYGEGDTLALVVDCRDAPCVRFVVNGAVVATRPLPEGLLLFSAIRMYGRKKAHLQIVEAPAQP